jgi:hypothetical protein
MRNGRRRRRFNAVLKGDMKAFAASGEKGLMQVMAATHAGMTTDEFSKTAADWFASARHPRFKRPYTSSSTSRCSNCWPTCARPDSRPSSSRGGVEFMRVFAEKVYGIPPEQVVGSTGSSSSHRQRWQAGLMRWRRSTSSTTRRASRSASSASSAGGRSCVRQFRRRPADAAVDRSRRGPAFIGIVHHTDAEREYAYDRSSHIGRLDKRSTRPTPGLDGRRHEARLASDLPGGEVT